MKYTLVAMKPISTLVAKKGIELELDSCDHPRLQAASRAHCLYQKTNIHDKFMTSLYVPKNTLLVIS